MNNIKSNLLIVILFVLQIVVYSQEFSTKAQRWSISNSEKELYSKAKDSIAGVFEVWKIKKIKGIPIDYYDRSTVSKIKMYYPNIRITSEDYDNFKAKKNKKERKVYLITFVKDSLIYEVLSVHSKEKGYEKIKIGHEYKLLLIAYFEIDCRDYHSVYNFFINGIETEGLSIEGYNAYTTPNLKRLYYVNP